MLQDEPEQEEINLPMAAGEPEVKSEIKTEKDEFVQEEFKKEPDKTVKTEPNQEIANHVTQNGQSRDPDGLKRNQSDIKRQIENNENEQPTLKKPKHENIETNVNKQTNNDS